MNSRLLAIGCDRYTHSGIRQLHGAEADARRVFAALTGPGQPYSADTSHLLLSPTKVQLDAVLRQLGSAAPVDVLTLYFAGHGDTREGSYYFCLQDSDPGYLSGTAFALTSWLNIAKELKPRYAYVITDSCFSGGSHHDIRNLLSDPQVGYHTASTFVCLAAASANQYAMESDGSGAMTRELLQALDGTLTVDTVRAELDLLDVARVVSENLLRLAPEQKPVAWGLNLSGRGRLCRNPRFASGGQAFPLPEIPAGSPLFQHIQKHSEELWAEYRAAAQGVNPDKLRALVRKIVKHPDVSPEDASVFIAGLANAFSSRMETRNTPWETAEVLGVFAVMLLAHVRQNRTAESAARELLRRKTIIELALIPRTVAMLAASPRMLLNPQAGMADQFYLPLRLTKLLATIVNTLATAEALGLPTGEAKVQAQALVKALIQGYPNAFRMVSDAQAPAAYLWFTLARRFGWTEELETVFGFLFTDMVSISGRVARGDLVPDLACEYCFARGVDPKQVKKEWLAVPSQLLAVLLVAAVDNGLEETVDPFLLALDRRWLNCYFSADYQEFAQKVMEHGVNRTHQVGQHLWTCADFARLWAEDRTQYLTAAKLPESEVEAALATFAALVFPDRLPLFWHRD